MHVQALLYTQKAQLFADSAFVVGYDTAIRLVAQRYYNDDEAEMLSELKGMRSRGCQVLVAGRVDKEGAFRTLHDIKMSPALQELVRMPMASERLYPHRTMLWQHGIRSFFEMSSGRNRKKA